MKIHLGDLRYSTVGRHSTYMPIAIGYVASYAQSQLGEGASFTLHSDPDDMIRVLDSEQPDIIGLSNYCWNAELSGAVGRHAKQTIPGSVIIGGGPEFPVDTNEIAAYLTYRDELDFYVYNYEGETAFAAILSALQSGISVKDLQKSPPPGVICLDADGRLNKGDAPERLKELDIIPSPVLSGMMDQFLNGYFTPFIETTRGCPYACTYCVQGTDWYNKVYGFSTERVVEELRYIGAKMADFPDIPLGISDSNFGMYQRDLETADTIAKLGKEFNWPRTFVVDTGKSQLERLIQVAIKLDRQISMSISPQTLNPETLTAIKRKNLGEADLKGVYARFKENGINTVAAVIVPLPEETKDSYIQGLRTLSDSEVGMPLPYTTMLLKGTSLASKESRLRHKMQTRFRPVPKQFGEIGGKRIFEYDEVCIATNTMSFEDYIECRGISFIFTALSTSQFDFLRPVTRELGIDWFDLVEEFWRAIKTHDGALGGVYRGFIQASHGELFDSPEAIQRFIADDENYSRMLSGELGENVIRGFVPKLAVTHFIEATDLALTITQAMGGAAPWFDSLSTWGHAVRDIRPMLELQDQSFKPITIELDYDIEAWHNDHGKRSLDEFQNSIRYELIADQLGIERAVNSMINLYGPDPLRWLSRLLDAKPAQEIWRRCNPV
ncbi:MAG: radical SAM protein [Proteobacteria bacterium]|nr:radical SAM protein [Pseudomonadota bacterium]